MENRKKIGKTKNEKYDTAKAKIGKHKTKFGKYKKLEKLNFENTKLEHGKLKTKSKKNGKTVFQKLN